MRLWMSPYGMIWVVFLEFLVVMLPLGRGVSLTPLHVALGFVILGLALYNFRGVRGTTVPARVKRTARATFHVSVAMVPLGFLLLFGVGVTLPLPILGITVYGVLLFLHVVNAFAIITQAAAVAIAYDMWEDREFVQETEPGVVPPRPIPASRTEGPSNVSRRESL